MNESRTGLNFFSGLIFTTAQVVNITARITFIHVTCFVDKKCWLYERQRERERVPGTICASFFKLTNLLCKDCCKSVKLSH